MKKNTETYLIIISLLTLSVIFCLVLSVKKITRVAGTNVFLQPMPVTILSTGDLMLGRSVNFKGQQKQDFSWSMREISPFLRQFDYTIANLENPIVEQCPLTNEGMTFCADPAAASALKDYGPDLVTLANNHIFNHGQEGLTETEVILAQNLTDYAVPGKLFIKRLQKQTFGVLALDDVTKSLDLADLAALIQTAREQVDVLLVALHFGQEYRYQPDLRQQNLARLAIDAGAAVVLGNHSHWFGPIELYNQGAIIYSHGNFVFDQMWSEETRQGVAAAWQFAPDGKLRKIIVYPLYITEYGKANLVQNTPLGEQIITKMQQISQLGEISEGTLMITP